MMSARYESPRHLLILVTRFGDRRGQNSITSLKRQPSPYAKKRDDIFGRVEGRVDQYLQVRRDGKPLSKLESVEQFQGVLIARRDVIWPGPTGTQADAVMRSHLGSNPGAD